MHPLFRASFGPSLRRCLALGLSLGATASAQVHYHPGGQPWTQRADSGPDAECPGWFYNLGVTGLRVRLDGDAPTELEVMHVMAGSPAEGRARVGDRVIGAGGARFETPHQNGYGEDVFGPKGPILDFARALDAALSGTGKTFEVEVRRGAEPLELQLPLPASTRSAPRAFSETFPLDCPKSAALRRSLAELLVTMQRDDGSWGSPVEDTFAPLALLATGDPKLLKAVERNARWHARTTSTRDKRGLVNWYYMSAAIVLSEYYLATRAEWVKPELDEVNTFLRSTQYTEMAQVSPRVKQSHPDAWPTNPQQQYGGWGHNPGFEGYGPIAMLTAQGAIACELMARCGVSVDAERLAAAHAFVARGSGRNGYVWYGDQAASDDGWADPGRTGATALAARLSRAPGDALRKRAVLHATVLGEHPESFPDTHGSPLMGMGYAAAGALADEASFLRLMRANRWWFVLSECHDGTFYYQPNRDNAGYGADARMQATATVAFILALPQHTLRVAGR
ncbi:MAG: DUF6288 domain-containing protein [Planctomycetota bacterium]